MRTTEKASQSAGKEPPFRGFIQTLQTAALSVAVCLVFYACIEGWPVWFRVKPSEVEKVVVVNRERGTAGEFSDGETIELAVKLVGFLNYVPFSSASEDDGPLIEMGYLLKDGTETWIAAGQTGVFWDGKGRELKKTGEFIHLAEGIFYWDEIAESMEP